ATGALVELGAAVGVVAALALGESASRLVRWVGGFGGFESSLERLTDLFENRPPRQPAKMAELDGIVRIEPRRRRGQRLVYVRQTDETGRSLSYCDEIEHVIPAGNHVRVKDGELVEAGALLSGGDLVPDEVLKIRGVEAVWEYLLGEIRET